MLSTIARAAIRRVGAGAVRRSTNQGYQSAWHAQRLRNPENSEFSRVLRRALATATTSRAAPAKPKKKSSTKAAKKPKKVAAKKKAAKPRKVVSPEEKAKQRVKLLKATALSPPAQLPSSTWRLFIKESLGGLNTPVTTAIQGAAAKFKSLSPSELEQLNHRVNQNKAQNGTAYKQWIDSHTPEQIRLANNARVLLKKLTGKRYTMLHDDRVPKQSKTSLALFTQDRWASGDLKGLKISEASKLLSQEFADLSSSERQAYNARAEADKERYIREFKAAFNREPLFVQKRGAQ